MVVLEGLLLNTLKQSLLTMCATPRPVHTVLTNKGFQRNHPRKQKAINLKRKKLHSQKDRVERMLNFKASILQARRNPTTEWSSGERPSPHNIILKKHPENWYAIYKILYFLSFLRPLL